MTLEDIQKRLMELNDEIYYLQMEINDCESSIRLNSDIRKYTLNEVSEESVEECKKIAEKRKVDLEQLKIKMTILQEDNNQFINTEINIYKSIKKGWRSSIGQEASRLCREYIFSNGWDNIKDDNVIDDIYKDLNSSFFVCRAKLFTNNSKSLTEFNKLLYSKIIEAFERFKYQKPTTSQISYYISLCKELDEEIISFRNNIEIYKELDKLIEKKKKRKG